VAARRRRYGQFLQPALAVQKRVGDEALLGMDLRAGITLMDHSQPITVLGASQMKRLSLPWPL